MDAEKTRLLMLSEDELKQFVTGLGQPKFRASQLKSWLLKGAEFEQMHNLPGAFVEKLKEHAVGNPVSIAMERVSKIDGTVKFLYRLPDGEQIEGVLMQYKHGHTLCVSTQVGCRMGCTFCASTLDGLIRNLDPDEMLGQVLCANRHLSEKDEKARVGNIVLMGSGEPLDNYDAVMRFLRMAADPEGLNMSMRSVSLSTCGVVPQMERLAGEGLPITLSVSLHAPNDEIRRTMLPVARAYSIDQVLEACRNYIQKTGRRVIIEYALVRGVNDGVEHADELAARLRGMQCHVNLIPLNAVEEREGLSASQAGSVEGFLRRLEMRHISATRRREMGDDIQGACGQLRRYAQAGGT